MEEIIISHFGEIFKRHFFVVSRVSSAVELHDERSNENNSQQFTLYTRRFLALSKRTTRSHLDSSMDFFVHRLFRDSPQFGGGSMALTSNEVLSGGETF